MNTTKQEFIRQIERIEDLIEKQSAIIDIVYKMIGTDGELIESIYDLQSEAVNTLEMLIGDKDNWINWYFFESCTLAVADDGLEYEITTAKELVEFCGWFEDEEYE